MTYNYKIYVNKVYDGDGTFRCDIKKVYDIDVGFNIHIEFAVVWRDREFRLFGIDTPELKGDHYEAGKIVRDYVAEKILERWNIGRTERDKTGKYGRIMGDMKRNRKWLTNDLLQKGYAKPYDGKKKLEWTKKELQHIIDSKK